MYDYEEGYEERRKSHNYRHISCFYDEERGEEVEFIWTPDYEKIEYYLFYDEGGSHTFHRPLGISEIDKYKLPEKELDDLITQGEDINELVSNQFVSKVLELISSGNYKYVKEEAWEEKYVKSKI